MQRKRMAKRQCCRGERINTRHLYTRIRGLIEIFVIKLKINKKKIYLLNSYS